MRILAIDPGEKRIGVAISDPTGTIATPLTVIKHVSRAEDAAKIARLARENDAVRIVIGQALDSDGGPTPQSRHAEKLAAAIAEHTSLPIVLWDESGSTQAARDSRLALGVSRRRRRGHLDELAAAHILQDYLDVQNPPTPAAPE